MMRHGTTRNNAHGGIDPPSSGRRKPPPPRHRRGWCSPTIMALACVFSSAFSFYAGIFVGSQMERQKKGCGNDGGSSVAAAGIGGGIEQQQQQPAQRRTRGIDWGINNSSSDADAAAAMHHRQFLQGHQAAHHQKPSTTNAKADVVVVDPAVAVRMRKLNYLKNRHPQTRSFLPASELVDRDEFLARFDSLGVPIDKSDRKTNNHVVIHYSESAAYPDPLAVLNSNSSYFEKGGDGDGDDDEKNERRRRPGVLMSVEDATRNCDNLHVVLTNQDRFRQCIALVGQYESFHVHKYMRVSEDIDPQFNSKSKYRADSSLPLRPVNRGMKTNGGRSITIPTRDDFRANWKALGSYLGSLESALEKLEPIAKSVASRNARNAVVVMVCNFGQSELLSNFVCHARAKGLSDALGSVLVFATDIETRDLAESMGLSTFHDAGVFGDMPRRAAGEYGDDTFRTMMFAKVYCVHMVSILGHDLLFQDVDVVWYQNPLEWFHANNGTDATSGSGGTIGTTETAAETSVDYYDVIFQDDGARTLFYAPYAANTGFYYARNNEKTRAFFNALLLSGDLILATYSHQIALVALVSEHASLYGLRVKVWDRDRPEFPGGHLFHERFDLMKGMIEGRWTPQIFHMSWTENKDDKVRFLQQMGQWYLEETCRNKPRDEIVTAFAAHEERKKNVTDDDLLLLKLGDRCCSVEPLVRCHYKDKPSVVPCPDAPFIDEDGTSFW